MLAPANRTTEARIAGLRPQISESLAHIGPEAAVARRYAPPIQKYPLLECREAAMVGIAVAVTVWSRAARKRESYVRY